MCREVKFGSLINHIRPSTWLATGHYARKGWHPTLGRPQLLRALDRNKDQTYYLASVSERSLARALFPLAGLHKPEVRDLAKRAGLPTAERDESMGICFVGEKRRFSDFIGAPAVRSPPRSASQHLQRSICRQRRVP